MEENVFGNSTLKKLKIGDIVSWSELEDFGNIGLVSPTMRKKFGFVTKLEIVFRGDRKVGIVKLVPMGTLIEKEVLAVCVTLVSQQRILEV